LSQTSATEVKLHNNNKKIYINEKKITTARLPVIKLSKSLQVENVRRRVRFPIIKWGGQRHFLFTSLFARNVDNRFTTTTVGTCTNAAPIVDCHPKLKMVKAPKSNE